MTNEKAWFDSFIESIPCPSCQTHFELFIKENPPDFSSRINFFSWTVKAHNHVNKANDKPEITTIDALIIYFKLFL